MISSCLRPAMALLFLLALTACTTSGTPDDGPTTPAASPGTAEPTALGCTATQFDHQDQPSAVPPDAERVSICPDPSVTGDPLEKYVGSPLTERVDHLVEFVRAQPEYEPPGEGVECPADAGPQFVLVFVDDDGRDVHIWADTGGCGGTLDRDASQAIHAWLIGDISTDIVAD